LLSPLCEVSANPDMASYTVIPRQGPMTMVGMPRAIVIPYTVICGGCDRCLNVNRTIPLWRTVPDMEQQWTAITHADPEPCKVRCKHCGWTHHAILAGATFKYTTGAEARRV